MTSTPVEPSVQHTPGPWRIGEARGGSGLVVYADTGSICDVWYWRQRDAECKANAALIAAAPSLLNVAKSTLHLLETASPELPPIAELRALIARAEGRQA